ncbi:uncharacterized protein KY384_008359 [Bacidia gigantensis]|uniref:uncharacterized protein n=1 Tax=Bacidia gigantensis TaxID=2732470 RepID=UPI001D045221|nr:uncharacterized protein KY384_008359 [Bacidia gigantensis]KAG8526930.1 hypothetical protein KY384_008359 [Bacidia gigantensis]
MSGFMQNQYTPLGNFSHLFMDVISSLTNCFFCFPNSPQLKINNRSFKLQHLLGEGGFSYVYLVSESSTSELYALKKIRCPFGQESVSLALKEVEAYALFSPHPHIIHAIDHSVVSSSNSSGADKTVYILLPYYRRGNLQDAINANLVNHTHFPERRLMVLFLGVARALRAMHQYRVKGAPGGEASQRKAKELRKEAEEEDADAKRKAQKRRKNTQGMETDGEDASKPLMEGEVTRAQEGVGEGELRPYAHRDVKPGNIMISDSGTTPILMDLGSLAPSPTAITSRSLALQVQDTAAEHSTMPYRAPELFDVKTGTIIDTKVDVWSFGCTLFACLVGKSPFEMRSDETGGNFRMRGGGKDKGKGKGQANGQANGSGEGKKEDGKIGERVKEVVRCCLKVEPAERPDIDELIRMLEDVIADSPEDDGGEL